MLDPKLVFLSVLVCLCTGCGESHEQHVTRLKFIGQGLYAFHDREGCFPLADGMLTSNSEYKPGLSWRVHLLPFLGQQALYAKFNLDEPWDSATNKLLIDQMPDFYRSPGVSKAGHTSLHGVIYSVPGQKANSNAKASFFQHGESVNSGGNNSPRRTATRDIVDGTANTIALIETGSNLATEWTRPGGIEVTQGNVRKCLGDVQGGFYVVLAHGDCKYLRADIDEKILEALITINGMEVIDTNRLSAE